MNTLWAYFWPIVAIGFAFGAIIGSLAFRRRRPRFLWIGLSLSIAGAALWHGPLGAADRLTTQVERTARAVLIDWEMGAVQAQLHHGPLTRRLILSGPADDFQRAALAEMMGTIPGVSTATWSSEDSGLPLLLEAAAVSILGFLFGLLLAYLVELRRRHNAQWNW
ncbi:MAG: hypothetical protein ACR2JJ_04170 [Sphingomicrobium sp.]